MADDLITRLERIARDAFSGETRALPLGENYFSFETTESDGVKSVLPRIWIDPATSDRQIGEKLRSANEAMLHPETLPDDASVPNIQTEGEHRQGRNQRA